MNLERATGESRIAVCSRDRMRRDAIAAFLDTLPDFTVVGHAGHTARLVTLTTANRPDIVLIDAGPRPAGATPAVRAIRERVPATRAVLLCEQASAPELAAAREAGAAAVVPYSVGLGGVLATLRTVRAGPRPDHGGGGLTARQREILALVAAGRSATEISGLLDISAGTVENHKRRVYAKLRCTTATEAVARAAALGLIDNSPPPEGYPPPEPRRAGTLLTVVVGDPGDAVDEAVLTLIRHGLPVVREHRRAPAAEVHWGRMHRGPVVRILVNPVAAHWWVAATLGWTAVLVHDGEIDSPTLSRALSRGVLAVLSAAHMRERLIRVLELVSDGYLVIDPSATGPFTDCVWARSAELPAAPPALTPREHDILGEIGRQRTVRQTARALGIALKTVENAQGHLFRKLGVSNRAAALAKAYSLGLLQPG